MPTQPLRFINFLAFNVNPAYEAICAEVMRRLGIPTSFEEGQTFDQFYAEELAVGYVCGLPYSKFSRLDSPPFELLAAPILQGERYQGRPVYFSDVIVRQDASYHSFDDLRGSTFAYNEAVSYSGYHVVAHELRQRQEDWGFFGKLAHSGAHLKSLAAVLAGDVDAAAIDSHALDVELLNDPSLRDKIRVVAMLGPSPIPPVVVGAWVSAEIKTALRDTFLTLHHNPDLLPILQACTIERFCAVEPSYYDVIHQRVAMSAHDFLETS